MMQDNNLSSHILINSATMVGACLTAIGLVKVVEVGKLGHSYVDELLAVSVVIFTVAGLLSYLSMRYAGKRRAARLELMADNLFLGGMVLMAVCAVLFAFEVV